MLNMIDLVQYVGTPIPDLGYATVRDFCDSADHLPQLMRFDGDMKDVQRTWAVKAILSRVPLGSMLLEVGAGEPAVAAALEALGYDVTVIDPYDGTGNGPQAYERYAQTYPQVKIVRAFFDNRTSELAGQRYSCIYSVSVLEHIPPERTPDVFAAIAEHLQPGGSSIHCVDHVVAGPTADWHLVKLRQVLFLQNKLKYPEAEDEEVRRLADQALDTVLGAAETDVETYYHSALGHNVWRGGLPYDNFPFRKIISVQTCVNLGS
jgi:hypothetical protein